MALTKIGGGVLRQPIDVGIITATSLNASGIVTAGTVQVGAATTIHTTGIDLGSGNITSHNINSTGIITATSFVGPVTGNVTGNTSGTASNLTGSPSINVTDITASGNVSIAGTLTYEDVTNIDAVGIITAQSDVSIADKIIHTGDTNTAIRFPADDTVTVETAGSERVRVTSAGDLFVAGTGGMNTTQLPNGSTININGNSSNDGFSVIRYSSGYGAYGLNIGRSKSGTVGTNVAVTNGNDLGHITFYGADGTDFNQAAAITAQVDGTPSDGTDMPGRLIFKTSSDGTATPTERLRITSGGYVNIGGNYTQTDYTAQVTRIGGNTDVMQVKGNSDNSFIRFTDTNASSDYSLGADDAISNGFILYDRNASAYRVVVTDTGSVGINQNSPSRAKLHVVGPGTGSDEIIAKFKGGSGGDCTSKIGIVAGYSDTANDTEGHVYIGALRQGNGNQSSMIFQTDGQNTRMRIAADGSTYRGGTVITESDMNWGHDTYQRPHIFSGQVGGNPSDGALVLASPETNPSNTRIGSVVYGCKTSSASGVANSGLKAAIECSTNTNVSDAWKTGGNLNFLVRPDNGNLSEVLKLNSFGDIYTRSIYSGNYGGGLFIGNNAVPTGNLCALRDGNKRPIIYLGGSYPEINLVHDVVSNTSHGPTIRFASYVQSTNTPTGSQFVIGTNGTANRLDIGYAAAAQNANIHNGIDNYSGGTTALRIYNTGSVVTPAQPGFYARRSTAGDGRGAGVQEWVISGTGSYNTGSHFNTSNGRFTAPVAGKYIFITQPGYKQTSVNLQFYFRINNSIVNEPVRVIDGGDDLTSHSAFTGSAILNLAVNDYVDIYIGNTHHVNTTYNFFTGYLLG